jgi:hypothetical protein
MTDPVRCQVLLKGIEKITFEELDPEWPKEMWDGDRDHTCHIMINIIYLIYLLRIRP